MTDVIRKDKFFFEELKNVFGPLKIIKSTQQGKSSIDLPVLLTRPDKYSDESGFLSVFDNELDRITVGGDIAFADGRGNLRISLSQNANVNTLLVTERCDNLCLFCSQPPRDVDDTILYAFAAQSIVSFNSDQPIGISGGEPLLDKTAVLNFFSILEKFENTTPLHILTNGRAFKDVGFVEKIVSLNSNREVLFGIPLYSTSGHIHDQLVNCDGAWKETIRGLINAGNKGLDIELRVIPTKKNFLELPDIIELSMSCFNSISRISIMNLEQTGWARKNWDDLYLKPAEYLPTLERACHLSNVYGVEISLFNYPLCHLSESLYEFSKKSISDWKNTYPQLCNSCIVKSSCGGFFTSIKEQEVSPIGRII